MAVRLRPYLADDLTALAAWWDIGVPFVERPDVTWSRYVLDQPSVHCWCSVRDEAVVAYSQVDLDGAEAAICVVTHPQRLRHGEARAHLRLIDSELVALGAKTVIAWIEPENAASIALFRACGYRDAGRNQDGDMLRFVCPVGR